MLTVSDVQIGNRADAVPSGWRFQNVLDGTRATHGQMSHPSGLQDWRQHRSRAARYRILMV